MGAPIGNKFWQLRSKHGRDKLFKSPELMWEAACEYFDWCIENPLKQQNWVGKDGEEVERKLMRPFTLSGLCLYLDCTQQGLRDLGQTKDFSLVYDKIVETVKTQKFEGAAVGLFNAQIIARDLGLKDNQDVTTNGEALNKYEVTLKL